MRSSVHEHRLLCLQAVVGVIKQQLQSACEAAQKDKEAAVSRSMQSVQRRASKEALQQVHVPSHLVSFALDSIFMLSSPHAFCYCVCLLVSHSVNTAYQSRICVD